MCSEQITIVIGVSSRVKTMPWVGQGQCQSHPIAPSERSTLSNIETRGEFDLLLILKAAMRMTSREDVSKVACPPAAPLMPYCLIKFTKSKSSCPSP